MKTIKGKIGGYNYVATRTIGLASPVIEYYDVSVNEGEYKFTYRYNKNFGEVREGLENQILALSVRW